MPPITRHIVSYRVTENAGLQNAWLENVGPETVGPGFLFETAKLV